MDPGIKKSFGGLVILSAVLFGAGMLLFRTVFSRWYFGFFPFLVLILFLVDTFYLVSFHRSVRQPDKPFIRGFMLSKVIKLMIYLLLVLIYILASPESAIPFAITLSVLYIAYAMYDLYTMTALVKRDKEKSTPPK
jgi:hypothetical protein